MASITDEEIGSQQDSATETDLPGHHGYIVDLQTGVYETDNDQEQSIEYIVSLPDNSRDSLIVRDPRYGLGDVLRELCHYHDLNPVNASPEDLLGKTVPVRQVEHPAARGEWVLDLPPSASMSELEALEPVNREKVAKGHRDILYYYRRMAVEAGYVDWAGEHFPRARWTIPDNDQDEQRNELLAGVAESDHISHILPTVPQTSSHVLVAVFGLLGLLFAVTVEFQLPYEAVIRGVLLITLIVLFVAIKLFLTRSVKTELGSDTPETSY